MLNLKNENLHSGHRERVKERFLRDGLEGFDEHIVLELMLFYGIPLKDTNEIAHRLIKKFGSLDRVLDASIEDLCSVPGVGRNTATLLKLFPAVDRYYDMLKHKLKPKLSRADDIAEFARARNRYRTSEVFGVVALDSECRYIDYVEISEGSACMTEINVRLAVDALLRSKAACVILVHNHPSGNLSPSIEDLHTTRALCDAMHLIKLKVLDHLIVSDNDYLSMRSQSQYQSIFD